MKTRGEHDCPTPGREVSEGPGPADSWASDSGLQSCELRFLLAEPGLWCSAMATGS